MKNSDIPFYQNRLIANAKSLRRRSTYTEKIVWNFLRNKQIYGYTFYRQRPIGSFIADFFCRELKLAIEIDGITHTEPTTIENDKRKTAYFCSLGITLIRFTDEEVAGNGNLVEEKIRVCVKGLENKDIKS
ncbi:MAG: endonuclease domain-containing protein [Chloroflexota bacterium]